MNEELKPKSEENISETEKIELKKKILKLAIGDWGNEFSKILSNLELFEVKRKTNVLYSDSGKKNVIKTLWERYQDLKQNFVFEVEKEYPELKEMRITIEESERIMQNVYSFLEKNKDENSEEFWKQIHMFLNESKIQYGKFRDSKDKLTEKILKEGLISRNSA